MKTKICFACKEDLPIAQFGSNGKTATGKQKYKARCHKCGHQHDLAYFYEKVFEAVGGKENMYCQICGYDKCLPALEFHHIDPATKIRAVSLMQNYSAKRIKAEIEKCILLCANCHREYHSGLVDLPVNAGIAHLVEHLASNQKAASSSLATCSE